MSIQITPEAHRILYMAEYNARHYGVCKYHMEVPIGSGHCCTTGHIFKAAGLDPIRSTWNKAARHDVIDPTTGLAVLAVAHGLGLITAHDGWMLKITGESPFGLHGTQYLALNMTGRLSSWNDDGETSADDVINALRQGQLIEEISLWP